MNVYLLTPILGYVYEVIHGEISEAVRVCEREPLGWESECERLKAFEGIDYIGVHVM